MQNDKFKPEFVPTIVFGKEAGLGTYDENEIEILGDDIQSFITYDFDVRREPVKPFKPGGAIQFSEISSFQSPTFKKQMY